MKFIEKFLLLSFMALSQSMSSEALIEGCLDNHKMKQLKSKTHLSLFAVYAPEKVSNPSYVKNSRLVISPLTIYSEVESLKLQRCGIRDENIEKISDLKKLKNLELPANFITDKGAEYLSEMTQLEKLNLSSNKITDKGVEKIANLPNLKELTLSLNDKITDEGIDFFKGHKSLEVLNIMFNNISSKKYEEISQNWNLKKIEYFPLEKKIKSKNSSKYKKS